jgi:hypothetical protein
MENESEIIGGLKDIYFLPSEILALEEKENLNGIKIFENFKVFNFNASFRKISKKFEKFEKFYYFAYKNNGVCLNTNEIDLNYKDKDREFNRNDDDNKKNVKILIENLNDYSIRKLKDIKNVNKRMYMIRGKKTLNNDIEFSLNDSNNNNYKSKFNNLNISNNNNNNNNDISYIINSKNSCINNNNNNNGSYIINLIKPQNEKEISNLNKLNFKSNDNNNTDNSYKNNNNNYDNNNNNNDYNDNIETTYLNSNTNLNLNLIHYNNENKDKDKAKDYIEKKISSKFSNNFFRNKLKIIKEEYIEEKNNENLIEKNEKNFEIFKKLNENSALLNRKYKFKNDSNELLKIFNFQNRHELIKDIFMINSHIRCSNYNEHQKIQKKHFVRGLSNEIDIYRNKMDQMENMPSLIKTNLVFLSNFLNKLKPTIQNTNSSSTANNNNNPISNSNSLSNSNSISNSQLQSNVNNNNNSIGNFRDKEKKN